jgi:hypothetical protein
MNRKLVGIGVGAAALGLALPSVASAHKATLACDTATGSYQLVADFQNLQPVFTVTNGFFTVRWNDGYLQGPRPVPGPCVPPVPPDAPPTPTPVPDVPEVVPPVPAPPANLTCAELLAQYPKAGKARRNAWGCPAPPVRIIPPTKVISKRTVLVVRRVACFTPGTERSYTVNRVRVQWISKGKVIRTKLSAPYRAYGAVCSVLG